MTAQDLTLLALTIFVSVFLASFVCFFLVSKAFNSKNRPHLSREAIHFIQDFMSSACMLLTAMPYGKADRPLSGLEAYRLLATGVCQHLPANHWVLVEKLDQAINEHDAERGWELLKLLSQSLANDGVVLDRPEAPAARSSSLIREDP